MQFAEEKGGYAQLDTDAQLLCLNESFRKVASLAISKKQAIKREFDISPHSQQLIDNRQSARDQHQWSNVTQLTKDIRKSIRKDRADALIANLEECLWYDLKKAKAGYLPTHTKLRKNDGNVANSQERPEALLLRQSTMVHR